MTAHLSRPTDPLDQHGLTPITTEHGLALFDAALTPQQPAPVPRPLNTARALTRQARQHALPPILSALTTSRPQATTASAQSTGTHGWPLKPPNNNSTP